MQISVNYLYHIHSCNITLCKITIAILEDLIKLNIRFKGHIKF